MNFDGMFYHRPNFEYLMQKTSDLKIEKDLTKQILLIEEINQLRNDIMTLSTIAQIRYYDDLNNSFYEEEMNFINEKWPEYELAVTNFYKVILSFKNQSEIVRKYGKHLLIIAKKQVNIVSPLVLKDLERENQLIQSYTKLISQSKIECMGELCNIAKLNRLMADKERNIRKLASDKKYELLNMNKDKVDRILDELVKVRTKIAKVLGYTSFLELAYDRLPKIGYGKDGIRKFRELIVKYFVPLTLKLREKQKERLELNHLTYYDEDIRYKDGNAKPNGNLNWLLKQIEKIFSRSDQMSSFFNDMKENQCLNLLSKENKVNGAFTTYISNFHLPYIFMNFNETSTSVKTLIHELGHAYQMYRSNQNCVIQEYIVPTKEACEIHSIALEFLMWPFMDEIFFEDTKKYQMSHLEDTLIYIPYRACIDEFQEYIYTYPDLSVNERKKIWLELEKKYQPLNDHHGNSYLEEGNFFHVQSHIFKFPFYYIDYAIAQICALDLWKLSQTNEKEAWNIYEHICQIGGSRNFSEILEEVNLASPFDEEHVKRLVNYLTEYMETL